MGNRNRVKATEVFLAFIRKIEQFALKPYIGDTPDKERNSSFYTEFLSNLSDAGFDALVNECRVGLVLPIYVSNMEDVRIDPVEMRAIGGSMNIKFFERIATTDAITGEASLSQVEVPVMPLMVRRQSQHLEDKISVTENNKVVDKLSGQPTGVSKAASLSLPEARIIYANGGEASLLEMIKVNGGDQEAYRHMLTQIKATGEFSLDPIMQLGSEPKSLEVMRSLFRGLQLDTTI